jgi:uncharacterized protein YkwD
MVFQMLPSVPFTLPRAERGTKRTARSRGLITVLAALAMLLSLTAFAGPATAARIHRTATESDYSNAVLSALNAERRAHHLPALRADHRLRLSARWHNLAMARANQLSHQLRGEAPFTRRIDKAGYHWSMAGENIAWNSVMTKRGVVTLEKLMYNERPPNDGHRQNILSRKFRNVGVDVYLDRTHHKVWLTTDFGRL